MKKRSKAGEKKAIKAWALIKKEDGRISYVNGSELAIYSYKDNALWYKDSYEKIKRVSIIIHD